MRAGVALGLLMVVMAGCGSSSDAPPAPTTVAVAPTGVTGPTGATTGPTGAPAGPTGAEQTAVPTATPTATSKPRPKSQRGDDPAQAPVSLEACLKKHGIDRPPTAGENVTAFTKAMKACAKALSKTAAPAPAPAPVNDKLKQCLDSQGLGAKPDPEAIRQAIAKCAGVEPAVPVAPAATPDALQQCLQQQLGSNKHPTPEEFKHAMEGCAPKTG